MHKKSQSDELFLVQIDSLSHDGRGVAHRDGKAVFIDGVLPGEQVRFHYTRRKKSFDEGEVKEIVTVSKQRVTPRCEHFGVCGGCRLQHLSSSMQITLKQDILLNNLQRIGHVTPEKILPPLLGESWGYRQKARLGVKYVFKKEKLLVGFRERQGRYLADISQCHVLHPSVGQGLQALADLIRRLSIYQQIPQVEMAIGDQQVALIFRHLAPLTDEDLQQLRAYSEQHHFVIYLQSGGPKTIQQFWPSNASALCYKIANFDVQLDFLPGDFTQVNSLMNNHMVDQAMQLLAPNDTDRILELFCGLGNFSLPIATKAGHVIAVEGEAQLIQRAHHNAKANGITNIEFFTHDLTADFSGVSWGQQVFDKMLIDPPRSGALHVAQQLCVLKPKRLVYVSCNPATLARDAAEIVHRQGYRLTSVGVIDMFPHTAHMESMAVFER